MNMNVDGSLLLRPAHISEAGAIASMSRMLIEHGLKWRWTPSRVRRSIRDRETMVLVASIEGRLSGFAIMKFRDEGSHLYLLAVAPKRQRTGIGSALLAWLEKSCRTAGMRHIRVEVRGGNLNAKRFYERAGFRFVGQLAGYYDRLEPATVMVKTLIDRRWTANR